MSQELSQQGHILRKITIKSMNGDQKIRVGRSHPQRTAQSLQLTPEGLEIHCLGPEKGKISRQERGLPALQVTNTEGQRQGEYLIHGIRTRI